MKLRKLALVPIAAALVAFGSPAHATWTASFNDALAATPLGLSGTLSDLGVVGSGEQYSLVLNTSGYSGGAGYLNSVDIKAFSNYDSFTFTVPGGAWANPDGSGGISNGNVNGSCNGANGGFACIAATVPRLTVPNGSYTFTFNVVGATDLNTTGINAHVGAGFSNEDGSGTYGILSQLTTPVPEPETYAMLLAGLGLMGFVARRRQRSLAA